MPKKPGLWQKLGFYQELNQYNCRMLPLFDQGYQFINTRVT